MEVVGVCIGDELLDPPSCGQLPGHRMEGLRAALSDGRGSRERTRGQRGKKPEWLRVCVWVQGVHRASVCAGWDPSRIRESEAKAAGQGVVLSLFWLLFFGGI